VGRVDGRLPGPGDREVDDRGGAAEDCGRGAFAIVVQGGELARREADMAVRVDAAGQHEPAGGIDLGSAGTAGRQGRARFG